MLQNLYENNILIYSFAGLCGLGLFIRLIINLVYKRLVKESDNMGGTKNKSLKHLKLKFETCYKLKIGVNNVDTFVDKNVLRYRFCGILLSTWENFCGQILFLSLLLVPISAVFGVFYQCGQDLILLTGAVGISASAVLILVDKSINLSTKKKSIKLNLMDFLENFLKVRLEQATLQPELIEQFRRDYESNENPIALEEEVKQEPKDELNRRREAKHKKDEEKKLNALKREEEQRRLEEARNEEEKRKIEERKQMVARRREEEMLKLEEEREALESRRAEAKKRAEDKKRENELKLKQKVDKDKLLQNVKDNVDQNEMERLIQAMNEIASERERSNSKEVTEHENKLIEDVLKEFFS